MRIEVGRSVEPARMAELLDLWVAAWAEVFPSIDFSARRPWFEDRCRAALAAGGMLITGTDAGALLGFALLDPAGGELDQIAVAPAVQKRGVATALLREAQRLAPSGLLLHVNRDNGRAVRFYERHAFVVVAEGTNPRSGLPTLTMRWRPDA